jgi:tRNA U34 5-methylaminomethyl-2-thiouridine-forming methyltransferase MnmC
MVATYSYARIVREGFAKAGFTVKDGPIVGRRSPSTLAYKGL